MALSDYVDIFFEDPVLVGIVVLILAFVFFVYLMIRRTITGFKEGMQDTGNNRR